MTDKSPQAFPCSGDIEMATDGMSLRDYFAGQALAGLSAHPDSDELSTFGAAELCFKVADAMLAYREIKSKS